MLAILQKIIPRGAALSSFVGGLFLIAMMLQIVLDVVLKFLFNAPIEGNLEVVSFYYMVGVVFLPLATTELRHDHINVDLFIKFFPEHIQKYFYILSCIIGIVFLSMLTYQTFLDAIEATRIGEVMMGSNFVTIWPSRWVLPVGFGLMVMAVFFNACMSIFYPDTFDPVPAAPEIDIKEKSIL